MTDPDRTALGPTPDPAAGTAAPEATDAAAVRDPSGPPDGILVDGVSTWFSQHVEGCRLPLGFELIAGGHSNLTFAVTDSAGHRYVLRRPPAGHLLPTAHDMRREHRIIAALRPAGIPVPPAIGLCVDPEVTGAPFYVMSFVDGIILRTSEEAESLLSEGERRRAGQSLVDTLAAIHELEPDDVGLGDLGRREGYIARQLRRWYGQYQTSRDEHGGPDVADVGVVHDLLAEQIPEQGRASIVHGDYRLDNVMVDHQGEVVAVLDWEICTLGDPLADLAQLLVYWVEPGEEAPLGRDASSTAGFPTRAQLTERYAQRTGRDLGGLDFYIAFASWKLACILEGVYTRYMADAMGATDHDWTIYPERIRTLAAEARATLGRPT